MANLSSAAYWAQFSMIAYHEGSQFTLRGYENGCYSRMYGLGKVPSGPYRFPILSISSFTEFSDECSVLDKDLLDYVGYQRDIAKPRFDFAPAILALDEEFRS
jgi:hypothetical protein